MAYETKMNPAKKEIVSELEETLGKAEAIYFTDFTGLSVAEINELRSKIFEAGGIEYLVAKNTLTKLALKNKGYDDVFDKLEDVLRGPTAMAIAVDSDPVLPAKIIADFAKAHKKPEFKGGLVDGTFYNEEDIQKLKDLPPTDVIRAQVIGGIVSPLGSFVGVLNETVRSFVGVIDAIIEKKKAEEGAAA